MLEAPTPELVIEPEGEIEHLQKFLAKLNRRTKYEISIYKRGIHFFIETEIPKDQKNVKYFNYYNLDKLKQINKFFALFDNIDDIIDTICENASNSCNILNKNNDYEIKIPVPVKNIKEITFILKEKKKNQKEIINELDENYHILNKKINHLELKVKSLEEENMKINNLEKLN
jgi:hypothetical protein